MKNDVRWMAVVAAATVLFTLSVSNAQQLKLLLSESVPVQQGD